MDDDALPPLAGMLLGLAVLDEEGEVMSELESPGAATIERIIIAFPAELDVWTAEGEVTALGASPPTQYTETTIMPVFHHLRLTLGVHDEHPA
jgi:hypothetical protein